MNERVADNRSHEEDKLGKERSGGAGGGSGSLRTRFSSPGDSCLSEDAVFLVPWRCSAAHRSFLVILLLGLRPSVCSLESGLPQDSGPASSLPALCSSLEVLSNFLFPFTIFILTTSKFSPI